MGSTIKTVKSVGMNAAKTKFKRVVQKAADITCDLIGNRIADKITSVGKRKNKVREKIMKQMKHKKPELKKFNNVFTIYGCCKHVLKSNTKKS